MLPDTAAFEHLPTLCLYIISQVTRFPGRNSTQIDKDSTGASSSYGPLWPVHKRVQRVIVGHAGQNDGAAHRQFSRTIDHARTMTHYILHFLPAAIIDGELIACLKQTYRHEAAHMPHAHKPKLWLLVSLSTNGHLFLPFAIVKRQR